MPNIYRYVCMRACVLTSVYEQCCMICALLGCTEPVLFYINDSLLHSRDMPLRLNMLASWINSVLEFSAIGKVLQCYWTVASLSEITNYYPFVGHTYTKLSRLFSARFASFTSCCSSLQYTQLLIFISFFHLSCFIFLIKTHRAWNST